MRRADDRRADYWRWARCVVAVSMLLLSAGPIASIATAYSDATQEIHRYTECTADGFCKPEFYVVLADPLIDGTMEIDYVPAADPHYWSINVTGFTNITVDAQENYDTRGCGVFFVDCPDTTHTAWLTAPAQCVGTVDLSTDVPLSFRMINVPQADQVLLDGAPANLTRWPDGMEITGFPVGTHRLVFTNPACDACGRSVGPGITMILLILVSLWIAFAAVGTILAHGGSGFSGGILVVMAGILGIVLAMTYLLPCIVTSIGLLVLALAILTLLFGVGLSLSGRTEED